MKMPSSDTQTVLTGTLSVFENSASHTMFAIKLPADEPPSSYYPI